MFPKARTCTGLALLLLLVGAPAADAGHGDLNGDLRVDVLDLAGMVRPLLGRTSVPAEADVTCDGTLDVTDLQHAIDLALFRRATLFAVSPISGPVGTRVTLVGQGLAPPLEVFFGAPPDQQGVAAAWIDQVSPAEVRCAVPFGAYPGPIVLRKGGATTCPEPPIFLVDAPTTGSGSCTPLVVTGSLHAAYEGERLTADFTASQAQGPVSWTLQGGALPPGLTLSSSGRLEGTPALASAGTWSFTVGATDSCPGGPSTGSAHVLLQVEPAPCTCAGLGAPGTHTLCLDDCVGILGAGTGSEDAMLSLLQAPGGTEVRDVQVEVQHDAAALAIDPLSVGKPLVNDAAPSHQVAAHSPAPGVLVVLVADPFTGSPILASGPLARFTVRSTGPAGSWPLHLARTVLSGAGGVSLACEPVHGRVMVQESLGCPPPPAILATSLPLAVEGSGYSTVLEAVRGHGALTWSTSPGSLPAGITLRPEGTLAGTPAPLTAGTYAFTVRAADSCPAGARTAQARLALEVLESASHCLLGSPPTIDTVCVDDGLLAATSAGVLARIRLRRPLQPPTLRDIQGTLLYDPAGVSIPLTEVTKPAGNDAAPLHALSTHQPTADRVTWLLLDVTGLHPIDADGDLLQLRVLPGATAGAFPIRLVDLYLTGEQATLLPADTRDGLVTVPTTP